MRVLMFVVSPAIIAALFWNSGVLAMVVVFVLMLVLDALILGVVVSVQCKREAGRDLTTTTDTQRIGDTGGATGTDLRSPGDPERGGE